MATKTEQGQNYPAEAFAYVPNPSEPSTWKIRLWDSPSAKETAAQVGRAVAALGAGFRGNKAKIPASARSAVVAKVRDAWKKTHSGAKLPSVLASCSEVNPHEFAAFALAPEMPPLFKTDDGRFVVQGFKVFKTGTFRDSTGVQHTVDGDFLQQVADNFVALRESGVFPNAPQRLDHSRTVDNIVGYYDNLYVDHTGEFLLGDFEFTDPQATANYAAGKFRSRSAEIGEYTTNSEDSYDPVFIGCAFVDLPAVEGLYSAPDTGTAIYTFQGENEKMATFTIKGVKTEDADAVQAYIADLEGQITAATATPKLHEFTLGDAKVADPVKVQAQLDRIPQFENFMADVAKHTRHVAVDDAIKANKYGAPQGAALKKFVESLTAEQFDAWKATTDEMPGIPAFGANVGGGNGAEANGSVPPDASDPVKDAQEMVKMHVAAGMSHEAIKQTSSFQRLTAAGITVAL